MGETINMSLASLACNDAPSAPAGLLVIGYGNTLRRDDGIGPKVAEVVAELVKAVELESEQVQLLVASF